jgi:hypothetical protein
MSLILIYQYWEDQFRPKIANELGINKKDLIEPIMGDLRRLRRSIIHHGGIALKDIEKCEILTWFKEGDVIFIDELKFKEIIKNIKLMIQNLKVKPVL